MAEIQRGSLLSKVKNVSISSNTSKLSNEEKMRLANTYLDDLRREGGCLFS